MSHHHAPMKTPTPLLIGAACLIALVLAFTTISRLTGLGAMKSDEVTSAQTLSLRFLDEADGGVGAYDAETGAQIFKYAPETGGFVRTALRALALDRRKSGIGSEPPFELTRTPAGRFVLSDPETGKSITLNAFGETNSNDFVQLFGAIEEGADG